MTETTTTAAPEAATTPGAAAAPATTPATTPSWDPSAPLPADWHLKLGDEYTPHAPTLERFANKPVSELAKSLVEGKQALSRKLSPPTAESTSEEVARWREAVGAPPNREGYALQKPEQLPDGVAWSDDRASGFAEIFDKWHAPKGMVDELMAFDITSQGSLAEAARASLAQAQEARKEALIKEWGGKYEEYSGMVRHLAERFGTPAGLEPEAVIALADDPVAAKLLFQIQKSMGEDALRTPAGYGDVRSPAQKAQAIRMGQDSEWSDRYANGDPAAMEYVGRLDAQAAGLA